MKRFVILTALCGAAALAAPAQTTITVNTTASPRAISPYIYGLNPYHYDNSLTGLALHEPGIRVSSLRFGGDAVSTYNWEKNVNISYDGSCGSTYATNSNNNFLAYAAGQPASGYGLKGGAILKFYSDAAGIGAYPLVQLTAMQYAAKDAAGCLGAACNQGVSSGRMVRALAQKPGALSLSPNLTDTVVYADEELNYLRAQSSAPTGPHGYCLENEPGIWSDTHPCAHPVRATCGEVLSQNTTLAQRIRALDGTADIYGPGMYGFTEYARLNYTQNQPNPTDWNTYNMSDTAYNAATYNYMTWVCSYLRQMRNAGNRYGQRLLDVLDVHYYNSGDNLAQDARSFWDSSYVENSYITRDVIGGASVKLVHCLKKAIADWYPGTKLAITEWGLLDNNDAASGIYTADMLGAMGRNGVYLANYFGVLRGFNAGAFKIFRNYDNAGSEYAATSVGAASSDNSKVTAYASITGTTDSVLHLVLINRSAGTQPINVQLSAPRNYTAAQAWGMDGSGSGAVTSRTGPGTISGNAFAYSLPAYSVYHLVLRGTATGVAEIPESGSMRIYPNPAGERLFIEEDVPGSAGTQIYVYDLMGRCVITQWMTPADQKAGLVVSGLAAGNYLLKKDGMRILFTKQ